MNWNNVFNKSWLIFLKEMGMKSGKDIVLIIYVLVRYNRD